MRKSRRGKKSENKERVQMKKSIGGEETAIEIEIVIEKETNVADVQKMISAATRAVIGKNNYKVLVKISTKMKLNLTKINF